MIKTSIVVLTLLLIFYGCDKGLSPSTDEKAGFSGTISFVGEWPEGITRTHLVVFENDLQSPADFNILNLKYVGPEITYGVQSYTYNSNDSAFIPIVPGRYEYVAVAQQKTEDLSLVRSDWTVAGIYYNGGNNSTPGILVIPENELVRNINITCDFNNPPPQPPGGSQ